MSLKWACLLTFYREGSVNILDLVFVTQQFSQ